jgi:D-sedoheptulose 7-phosphate isomerase
MQDNFIETYLEEVQGIAKKLDQTAINKLVELLAKVREDGGRLYILGVGGSAANATHAVNDFRKITNIESYTPIDNVAELTARVNDDGWESVFAGWLKTVRLNSKDCLLILSVGGGDAERNISTNLVKAMDLAKEVGAKIAGIVGPRGGHTALVADAYVKIPEGHPDRITAHTESFQAVVWHLLVSHPKLKTFATKWEAVNKNEKKQKT